MSLIDEALKRARLDTARQEGEQRGGPDPWLPAQRGDAGRSRRALVAGVLCGSLGVALLGGTTIWWSNHHVGPSMPQTDRALALAAATGKLASAPGLAGSGSGGAPVGQVAELTSAAAGSASGSGTLAGGESEAPSAAPAGRSSGAAQPAGGGAGASRAGSGAVAPAEQPGSRNSRAKERVKGKPPAGEPDADAAPASTQESAQPGAANRPGAPAKSPSQAPAKGEGEPETPAPQLEDGKEYGHEVRLPGGGKLTLSGIALSEHPVAVINGRVVAQGEVVAEFTVVHIQSDRVELRGRGITLFLLLN